MKGTDNETGRQRRALNLGWIGMVLVVGAFATANLGMIDRSGLYFGATALGSVLLCVANFARVNYPSLALNAIWTLIAIASLLGAFAP
ncbi:MAG: hypothetical protein H6832_15150 [Planctomycetes bacterium]|nr:hypothetical protein [Planctomycetota bacterium]